MKSEVSNLMRWFLPVFVLNVPLIFSWSSFMSLVTVWQVWQDLCENCCAPAHIWENKMENCPTLRKTVCVACNKKGPRLTHGWIADLIWSDLIWSKTTWIQEMLAHLKNQDLRMIADLGEMCKRHSCSPTEHPNTENDPAKYYLLEFSFAQST